MVKIVKESKSDQTDDEYVATVEGSIRRLKEFYNRKGMAVHEGELMHECKSCYGESWSYDAQLDACIDNRQNQINERLKRVGEELVFTYSVGDREVRRPDRQGQCPSGWRYSGLWQGCIRVDDIPEPVSTFAKVGSNQNTVMGQSPGDYAMRSGSPMENIKTIRVKM